MVKQPAQLIRFAATKKAMKRSVVSITMILLSAICFSQKKYVVFIQLNNADNFFINKTAVSFSEIKFINKDTIPKVEKKDDAFSRLMAGVVNDTAILYNSYVDVVPKKDTIKTELLKKATVKKDNPVVVINKKDSAKNDLVKKDEVKKVAEKTDTVIALIPPRKYKPDTVKTETAVINKIEKKKDSLQTQQPRVFAEKLLEEKTDSSVQLIYASINKDGKRDTVYMSVATEKVIINKLPPDTINKVAETIVPKKDTVRELPKEIAVSIPKTEEKNNAPVLITSKTDSINNVKKDTTSTESKASPKIFVGNTNCKNLATDYDVDKLRVKMIAAENEDDKIFTARKFFRIKCFSTNQIKALSEVFPTDEGRYKLFDTAYPFVSDYGNYPQLSTLLTSQYYINRFSAMIKQ